MRQRLPQQARIFKPVAEASLKLVCMRFLRGHSVDHVSDTGPADLERPAPGCKPARRSLIDGEEKQARAAYEIFLGHIAHAVADAKAAIGRIVPVIAHHEIMFWGHDKDFGIIGLLITKETAGFGELLSHIRLPVRQRLAILMHGHVLDLITAFDILDAVINTLAFDWHVIDIENAIFHLDLVARQAHKTLNEIGRIILGRLEYDDISPVRLRKKDPSAEKIEPQRK